MTHYGGNNPCHEFCFPLWKKGKPIAQCGCREGYVLKSNVSCVGMLFLFKLNLGFSSLKYFGKYYKHVLPFQRRTVHFS